jgi:hypothetical protein
MGLTENKNGNDASARRAPLPAYILMDDRVFVKRTIWTSLDRFAHVEPFSNLVNSEYRKMEPPSYHLRQFPGVKKFEYFPVSFFQS